MPFETYNIFKTRTTEDSRKEELKMSIKEVVVGQIREILKRADFQGFIDLK